MALTSPQLDSDLAPAFINFPRMEPEQILLFLPCRMILIRLQLVELVG